jgi:hypothetical protein
MVKYIIHVYEKPVQPIILYNSCTVIKINEKHIIEKNNIGLLSHSAKVTLLIAENFATRKKK